MSQMLGFTSHCGITLHGMVHTKGELYYQTQVCTLDYLKNEGSRLLFSQIFYPYFQIFMCRKQNLLPLIAFFNLTKIICPLFSFIQSSTFIRYMNVLPAYLPSLYNPSVICTQQGCCAFIKKIRQVDIALHLKSVL